MRWGAALQHCCRSRWRSYSPKVEELQCKVENDTCKCRQIVDRGGREGEKKKAEAEKEAKAKLLTQSSITELYIVQVKKKLESAKEAFENAD